MSIDFREVHRRIAQLRRYSWNYLEDALADRKDTDLPEKKRDGAEPAVPES